MMTELKVENRVNIDDKFQVRHENGETVTVRTFSDFCEANTHFMDISITGEYDNLLLLDILPPITEGGPNSKVMRSVTTTDSGTKRFFNGFTYIENIVGEPLTDGHC